MRLDVYLVENNYFSSRTKAQIAIKNGDVTVNGKTERPSYEVIPNDVVYAENNQKYVGRGGYKLEKAITEFSLDFSDKTVLDIGASTGGFTDCALVNGAKKVYAVDVGHGQLDEKLIRDKRVVNLEGTDIRALTQPEACDLATVDVSFISLEHILPHILKHIKPNADIICLIKPQYEIGKKRLKNGIVKEEKDILYVLEKILYFCTENNFGVVAIKKSPIRGGDGNTEFLFHIKYDEKSKIFDLKSITKGR